MTTIDEPQEIDTGTTDLIATRRDGVLTLTLNRPERRNAMTPAMMAALGAQLHDAETSELVGAVVITGAGAAFCAGGDVKSFNERGGESRSSPPCPAVQPGPGSGWRSPPTFGSAVRAPCLLPRSLA
jgi:enoyl-CoA hydratase/carnithine racemase